MNSNTWSVELTEQVHREFLHVAWCGAWMVLGAAIPFTLAFAGLAYAIIASAPVWILATLGVALLFAGVMAWIVLQGANGAGLALSEIVAGIVQRQSAEADRIQAEADAIRGAHASQIAIGSNIKQQFKPTVYRVNGQVVNGNQLNQLNQAEPRRIEIPAADVRWFAEQLANGYGHSKSKWVIAKVELPFSRLPVDWTIYKALVDPLAEGGAIVGRGERSAGRLVTTDPAQLVKVIEQKHPDAGSKGITLELPAEASYPR